MMLSSKTGEQRNSENEKKTKPTKKLYKIAMVLYSLLLSVAAAAPATAATVFFAVVVFVVQFLQFCKKVSCARKPNKKAMEKVSFRFIFCSLLFFFRVFLFLAFMLFTITTRITKEGRAPSCSKVQLWDGKVHFWYGAMFFRCWLHTVLRYANILEGRDILGIKKFTEKSIYFI